MLYLAFSKHKINPSFQILGSHVSHDPHKQILRSCLYSGKSPPLLFINLTLFCMLRMKNTTETHTLKVRTHTQLCGTWFELG